MRDAFLIFLLAVALMLIGTAIWLLRMLFTYQTADEDEAEAESAGCILGGSAVLLMLLAGSAIATVGHAVGVPMPYTFIGGHRHG
ncbi:hypothetical protein GCM10023196_037400 [Actinoallomurus vinaceus]|uniref:Uncharacterized protein n=1 Tax=Actinoallomurus vinaceus TaxID=1080074 RepID=A0ABP8UC25_9ACTN